MRKFTCLLVYVFLLSPALANKPNCFKSGNIHVRLADCNRLISSGSYSGHNRALLHFHRAQVYAKLGYHRKAISDFSRTKSYAGRANTRGREIAHYNLLALSNYGQAQAYLNLNDVRRANARVKQALNYARRINNRKLVSAATSLNYLIQQHQLANQSKSFNGGKSQLAKKYNEKTQKTWQPKPTYIPNKNIPTASVTKPTSETSYLSYLVTLLILCGLGFVAYRYGWPRLQAYIENLETDTNTEDHTETILMSETKSATLETFAPADNLQSNKPVNNAGAQPKFDVSNMKLHWTREQKRSMSGTVTYTLHLFVEMSDDAKKAIKHYGFGNEVIYTKKPAIQADSLWAKLNPIKWVMHIIWWLMTRRLHAVRVKELVTGKTLKCKDIFEMIEIEDQILASMKTFGRIMYAAAHFGGEEIINIDQEIGLKHAKAA